jgi:hypothetical protein
MTKKKTIIIIIIKNKIKINIIFKHLKHSEKKNLKVKMSIVATWAAHDRFR